MRALLLLGFVSVSAPAVAGTIAVVNDGTSELMLFNTVTQTFRTVGNLGVRFSFGGLAWDSDNQRLYLTDYSAPYPMYELDTQTGQATLIGSTGMQMISAAYDPIHAAIWAADIAGTGWYTLNPATAAATPRFNFGITASGSSWSTRENAIVYNNIGTADFYAFDPDTGLNSRLGSGNTFINDAGMTYDPETDLYWIFDYNGRVLTADPNNGYAVTQVMNGPGPMDTAELLSGQIPGAFQVNIAGGACPGNERFVATGATPNGDVAFAGGVAVGQLTLRSGPCAGTQLPMRSPHLIRTVPADAAGEAVLLLNVPAQACGQNLFAVDLSTCAVTRVIAN